MNLLAVCMDAWIQALQRHILVAQRPTDSHIDPYRNLDRSIAQPSSPCSLRLDEIVTRHHHGN
jgi:hypothetical protein